MNDSVWFGYYLVETARIQTRAIETVGRFSVHLLLGNAEIGRSISTKQKLFPGCYQTENRDFIDNGSGFGIFRKQFVYLYFDMECTIYAQILRSSHFHSCIAGCFIHTQNTYTCVCSQLTATVVVMTTTTNLPRIPKYFYYFPFEPMKPMCVRVQHTR